MQFTRKFNWIHSVFRFGKSIINNNNQLKFVYVKIASPEMHIQYTIHRTREPGSHRYERMEKYCCSIRFTPVSFDGFVHTKQKLKNKMKKKTARKCMSMCTEHWTLTAHTYIVFIGLTVMPYAFNCNVCIGCFFGGCCVKSQFSSQSVMHYIRSYRCQLPHFESLTAAFMWSMNFDCYINTCTKTNKHTQTYARYSKNHHPVSIHISVNVY